MNYKNRFQGTPSPPAAQMTEEGSGLASEYNDNWAQVELFRWQYGELPKSGDARALDLKVAAQNMARAILDRKVDPFNAASAIAYLGKKAGEKK